MVSHTELGIFLVKLYVFLVTFVLDNRLSSLGKMAPLDTKNIWYEMRNIRGGAGYFGKQKSRKNGRKTEIIQKPTAAGNGNSSTANRKLVNCNLAGNEHSIRFKSLLEENFGIFTLKIIFVELLRVCQKITIADVILEIRK